LDKKNIKRSELHIHLDGSIEPLRLIEMAKTHNIILPCYEEKCISNYLNFDDKNGGLLQYLKKFHYPIKILQYKDTLKKSMYYLLEKLHRENYIYAEIRFAPHLHTENGLSLEEIVDAVICGGKLAREKYGIDFGIILCIMRNNSVKMGYEIVELAKQYKNRDVVGIDLAGDEKNYPVNLFKDVFSIAKKEDINITIHAGEASGYESVKDAIYLGAKRIGHGIRAFEDKKLLELIVEQEIVLEICPISNYQTKVLKNIKDYPIREFLDRGIKISLNTDNLTVSNTNLDKEIEFLNKNFSIKEKEIIEMLRNNIICSFVDYEKKEELLNKFNNK